MSKPLKAILIGFGNVAASYASDQRMLQHYRYATHVQVLTEHPNFELVAVVDTSPIAQAHAKDKWKIPHVYSSVSELAEHIQPDVAVIAIPPTDRLSVIKQLPTLKAIFVEKPLALNFMDAVEFISYCKKMSILVQVNYWRRGDEFFRKLAAGLLKDLIGKTQAVFGIYGNGLLNNGSHMIDFIRMLTGEVRAVQAVDQSYQFCSGPINNDTNIAFNLCFGNKVTNFQPVEFANYRECSLDLWGTRGRLSILQEGLKIFHYPCLENRSTQNTNEIASDRFEEFNTTVGYAFYHMYTNLFEAVCGNQTLYSSADNALINMHIVDAIKKSASSRGSFISFHDKETINEI